MKLVIFMRCQECGSEEFVTDGGWHYCKKCGRVVDVVDYESEYLYPGGLE